METLRDEMHDLFSMFHDFDIIAVKYEKATMWWDSIEKMWDEQKNGN